MSVHQIWAAVATVFTIVAAVVVLAIYGKDATTLLLVVSAVVSPVISSLVVTQKISELRTKVDGVDTKVNGHLTAIVAKIPDPSVNSHEEETV